MSPMDIQRIVLLTDFGQGIYVGQMKARLHAMVPEFPVIDLVHDLPPFRPDLAACLLPGMVRDMPEKTLYICVIDPGVGGDRGGLVAEVDGNWYVGPDNGLFAVLLQRAVHASVWHIGWQPHSASATFHGRDWFVPVAARLCRNEEIDAAVADPDRIVGSDWPQFLAKILYVDRFGNLMTGLRVPVMTSSPVLVLGQERLRYARTFSANEPGQAFWYENALGLVEISVNQGRADQRFGMGPGDSVGPFETGV